ncbi:hypothetical protein CFP65_2658 [Kitasatospora sp. MMS16-BH015]|uniref:hypothetical protein n=1 Tax=Kitasatospora sp. MMS16-BH015 TaxID=2018025 RepID=UPI000CA272C7|nr:hypothetical protein [Kitasatospora sp. MMS16-BH015]AUG77480.1 hypothetical protein CFP65_2658 [Kitasatospora sp. MMS16-BH015]
MRNGLVQLGAWAAATGAAVLLSWLGVHAVLSDASSAHPVPLPLPTARPATGPPPPGGPHSPEPAPADSGAPSTGSPSDGPPSPSGTTARPTPHPTASRQGTGTGTPKPSSVRSYLVPGGRVALDIRPDAAELVSATPDSGWQLQYWTGDQWMRFDFTKDGATNSVFVTWNGHAPDVQTVVR